MRRTHPRDHRSSAALIVAAAVTLLAAPAASAAVAREGVDSSSRLSGRGLGAIEIGMSERAAERAGGFELEGGSGRGCHYLTPADKSVRALFMMNRGRVVRIDVVRRGIRTNRGVRVGDSEAALRKRFAGRIRVEPQKYIPGGSTITFLPARGNRRVIAETDGEKVLEVRGGRLPEVGWVERCS